jgi:hypothetical protein
MIEGEFFGVQQGPKKIAIDNVARIGTQLRLKETPFSFSRETSQTREVKRIQHGIVVRVFQE